MNLFGYLIPVTGVTFLMFALFAIIFVGYLLGRITVKGVNLGTAGVFIMALVFGAIFFTTLKAQLTTSDVDFTNTALKIVENLGLILFVTSVGFIAGPNFIKNFKANFKSYILIAVIIILSGSIATWACWAVGRGSSELGDQGLMAMLVGIMSGSLTSTPAFSAAKVTAAEVASHAGSLLTAEEAESLVTVGHGIAYIFGVIGVVLFVQLIPKFMKANMEKERSLITLVDTGAGQIKDVNKKHLELDDLGLCVFGLAVIIGLIVGNIKIPLSGAGWQQLFAGEKITGTSFSLTTTGGTLLSAIVFGHFGHCGNISLKVDKKILEHFREFGLVLFLLGAGIAGGAKFIQYFKVVYFVYGVVITIVPMIIGFLFSKYVLKLPLLNNLGSITGGMTSTPALGTLIHTAGTGDVANSYAATYPFALICVVLCSQFLVILFSGV